MKLELLKVICQVVALERDDDGKVVGERFSEPVPLYSLDDLPAFVKKVGAELEEMI